MMSSTSAAKETNATDKSSNPKVTFVPSTKLQSSPSIIPTKQKPTNTSTTPQQPQRPKKQTHFGKAHPVRDACLLVGFVAAMLLISTLFDGVGEYDPTKKSLLPSLSDIRQQQRAIETALLSNDDGAQSSGFAPPSGNEECALLLGPSSTLPRAGSFGVFAGKDYATGDAILPIESSFWPPITLQHVGLSTTSSDNDDENKAASKRRLDVNNLSTITLLIKPHSLLANVAWNDNDSDDKDAAPVKLVATKPIQAGEEIFVAWDDHVYHDLPQLFPSLPTPEQFRRADAIIQETRDVFRIKTGENKVKKGRIPELNKGLLALRKGLDRYDQTTARLVPLTVNDLLLYHNASVTTALQTLQRPSSLAALRQSARCLTQVVWKRNNKNNHKDGEAAGETAASTTTPSSLTTTQRIPKGELIMPVPLLLHCKDADEKESSPNADVCNSSTNEQSLLESLLPFPSMFCRSIRTKRNNNDNSQTSPTECWLCPLNGVAQVHQATHDPQQANAKYQWSARSEKHQALLDELRNHNNNNSTLSHASLERTRASVQKHALAMSWDLVATRDIAPHETVRVYVESE